MLSGIGPRDDAGALGIAVRVDLPGVGRNLQDRYEVGVVNRMTFDALGVLARRHASPRATRCIEAWAAGRDSLYATNGAGLAVITALRAEQPLPDLFCMALLGRFRGYFPGYARELVASLNYLTWADPQGAYRQPRRRGHAALGRPARPAADQLPLLRGRHRRSGQDLDAVVERHPLRAPHDPARSRTRA